MKTFDEQVAALRGTVEPKGYGGKKSDATPEQWAAHLDWRSSYSKAWRSENPDAVRRWGKGYRSKMTVAQKKEKSKRRSERMTTEKRARAAKLRRQRWRADPEKYRAYQLQYVRSLTDEQKAARAAARREWEREKLANDPQYAIRKAIRTRINIAIKRGYKAGTTVELLGCSMEFYFNYLESLFDDRMNWSNWGQGRDNSTWHIDHIKQLKDFADLTDPEQQKQAFHYTNTRPMWGSENIRRGTVVYKF